MKKTAATKTAAKTAAASLPPITVADLEQALAETVGLIEEAEGLAPAGLVTQKCQLAKVRAKHAAELLEALKP